MALIVMPSLLSKRPWARIRARCEASFFIVLSKSARCCSVRGHTYLTLIHLGSGFTYRIVLKLSRGILYQKTFGRALNSGRRTLHDPSSLPPESWCLQYHPGQSGCTWLDVLPGERPDRSVCLPFFL